jgi:hypothetical protein
MKYRGAFHQRGQAMSEFVAATALLVPLLMAIVYIGKYADVKHEAIQASRYAAFEQALDPSAQHESANNSAVLIEETKERFFTDGSRNNGKIGYQDTTASLSTAGTLNPVWNQLDNSPMIAKYQDVSVKFSNPSLNSTALTTTDDAGKLFFGLSDPGPVEADVEVSLANIAHFAPLKNVNLKVGATTVVAGDAWNAGGAAAVASSFTPASVPTSIFAQTLKPLTLLLDPLFQLLSDTNGPQWGCVNADAVPKDDLSPYNQPAPCSD